MSDLIHEVLKKSNDAELMDVERIATQKKKTEIEQRFGGVVEFVLDGFCGVWFAQLMVDGKPTAKVGCGVRKIAALVELERR